MAQCAAQKYHAYTGAPANTKNGPCAIRKIHKKKAANDLVQRQINTRRKTAKHKKAEKFVWQNWLA